MREVLSELLEWWRAGETVGMATVVGTYGSAPRSAGTSMLVGPGGQAVGSISGGCVEGAVYDLAQSAIDSGRPVVERYGVSDESAFAIGLTCGGTLDVFVESVDQASFPELIGIADDVVHGRRVAVATIVEHPELQYVGRRIVVRPDGFEGTLGSGHIDDAVADDARGLLAAGRSQCVEYGPDGERRGDEMRAFVEVMAPRPNMLVFGSTDFAGSMAALGSFLGYHVTVCDARPAFATRSRFPTADELVVAWPSHYLEDRVSAGDLGDDAVVCVLTHDPKFDVPLLEVALRLPIGVFVGAMGSRRTHDKRVSKLRARGLSDTELDRLASPIGLDLGAQTPEETAVSIAAEIIAHRTGGSGRRLSQVSGRIHKSAPVEQLRAVNYQPSFSASAESLSVT